MPALCVTPLAAALRGKVLICPSSVCQFQPPTAARTLTRGQLGECRPLPKLPLGLGGVSRLLSLLISLRAGVSNLYLSGRVRLSLAPLLNRLPVVAAVTVRSCWCCVSEIALPSCLNPDQPARGRE